MKDYSVYLWVTYLVTLAVLLINLIIPLIRYYKLRRKKQTKLSDISRKQC
ncbi:MAG: heme exporter protein CcmD [Rickettsiella sp.]|nr:heme exporter protein CcmD [Rickettsiella sp.]